MPTDAEDRTRLRLTVTRADAALPSTRLRGRPGNHTLSATSAMLEDDPPADPLEPARPALAAWHDEGERAEREDVERLYEAYVQSAHHRARYRRRGQPREARLAEGLVEAEGVRAAKLAALDARPAHRVRAGTQRGVYWERYPELRRGLWLTLVTADGRVPMQTAVCGDAAAQAEA
ncbi:MAG: hypothetical protein WKG32_08335, partial [Gemmatimonadaceae bacterium]